MALIAIDERAVLAREPTTRKMPTVESGRSSAESFESADGETLQLTGIRDEKCPLLGVLSRAWRD